MPRKQKIDLDKVRACLDTVCTKCGHRIPPAEVQRIDFTSVKCPACGEVFVAAPAKVVRRCPFVETFFGGFARARLRHPRGIMGAQHSASEAHFIDTDLS